MPPGNSCKDFGSSSFAVDGTLVRVSGRPAFREVFIILGGAKFLVTGSYPIDSRAVTEVPIDVLQQFGVIPRDGTVVQEFNSTERFIFRNGKKVRIPNDDEFARAGLHSRYIRTVPLGATSWMPTAEWFTLPSLFPGDLDANGAIDCVDLRVVRSSFGKREMKTGFDSRADVNGDGVVDIRDLALVSQKLPVGTLCQQK